MIELDMPVDVGIKLILSAGAVSPEVKPEPAGRLRKAGLHNPE